MPPLSPIVLLLSAVMTVASASVPAQTLAPTPPMGWNSWDAYGLSIDEADFKANVAVLAGIKQYGWQYAVIDEGWYMQDPFGGKVENQKFVFDANGRLIPALNRFPSAANGAGLKPLADWVHGQGLKFGIHLVRGIPREDVTKNTPIAGSAFTAQDAGDTADPCPWDQGNWGVKDNAAGQAWYDSMIALYAAWGVDYLKVDCISSRPYKGSEIRQIAAAIKKTGRPIVLSLSPGPTSVDNAADVAKYSQLWRISDDHWDVWHVDHKPPTGPGDSGEFPFGTRDAFDRLAKWQPYVKPGSWPDEDMLPFGSLTPHPGWGQPRESRLTHDEERTEMTLWAIARSPLILGANLTKLDDFTRSLITSKDLIHLDQNTVDNHPFKDLPSGLENVRVWEAQEAGWRGEAPLYIALFNLADQPVDLHFAWAQLGLKSNATGAQNILDGSKSEKGVQMTLAAHSQRCLPEPRCPERSRQVENAMRRRSFLGSLAAACIASQLPSRASTSNGQRLADAARAQIGVTTGYDPTWVHLAYPNGDVPRTTGVCADVVVRAARDGLGLDLQKLVHEDMERNFDAYPARKAWGSRQPDANIDHRRVLNLQAYWQRAEACLWYASASTFGDSFPPPLVVGDIVTWLLNARLPHIGIVASTGTLTTVVHNIGNGAEETDLRAFHSAPRRRSLPLASCLRPAPPRSAWKSTSLASPICETEGSGRFGSSPPRCSAMPGRCQGDAAASFHVYCSFHQPAPAPLQ